MKIFYKGSTIGVIDHFLWSLWICPQRDFFRFSCKSPKKVLEAKVLSLPEQKSLFGGTKWSIATSQDIYAEIEANHAVSFVSAYLFMLLSGKFSLVCRKTLGSKQPSSILCSKLYSVYKWWNWPKFSHLCLINSN